MASITVLSCFAVGAGLYLSFVVGGLLKVATPIAWLLAIFVAPMLGIALAFAAGLSHMFCEHVLHFCSPTSDTTVWSVAYPLIAIPLFMLVMIVAPKSKRFRHQVVSEEANAK